MSLLRRQRRAPSASRARLQPRQFPAHVGDARANQGIVAYDSQREADQDRREGREPWPLCNVPNGKSRYFTRPVRRHSADDRGAATATLGVHGVGRSRVMSSSQMTGAVRPHGEIFDHNRCQNSAFGRSSTILRFEGVLRNGFPCQKRHSGELLGKRPSLVRRK
jgi:hypothetical protein